jgi:hypothetical protein
MFITECFKSIHQKLSNWYFAVCCSREYIEILQATIEELTVELDYEKYIARREAEDAKHEQENFQYILDQKQGIIDDYVRDEQERRAREEEEEQEYYRSNCPHCNSLLRFGRCPACDSAFGRS